MGIQNLLKHGIKGCVENKTSVASIVAKGMTRAVVDVSGWEHDASNFMSCAVLEERKNDAVAACNRMFKQRLDMLGREGVTRGHFVFDGRPLPSKAPTKTMSAQ